MDFSLILENFGYFFVVLHRHSINIFPNSLNLSQIALRPQFPHKKAFNYKSKFMKTFFVLIVGKNLFKEIKMSSKITLWSILPRRTRTRFEKFGTSYLTLAIHAEISLILTIPLASVALWTNDFLILLCCYFLNLCGYNENIRKNGKE